MIDKGRALVFFCLSEYGMVRQIDSLDNRELLKTLDLFVAIPLSHLVICLTNSKGILDLSIDFRHSQYPMGSLLVLKLFMFSNPICTTGLLIDRS